MPTIPTAVAVLASGGTDSAVLLDWLAGAGHEVHPLYLRQGAPWEDAEVLWLGRFLDAVRRRGIRDLAVLDAPLVDLYPDGAFGCGGPAPRAGTPDADVYLPGRNLTLLAKAGTFAALRGLDAVALAPLDRNPFPDGTPAFFAAMTEALSEGLGRRIEVLTPFRAWSKADVLREGRHLPLGLTFSCAQPVEHRHCGRCSKCYERHRGFLDAGLADPTGYAETPLRPGGS